MATLLELLTAAAENGLKRFEIHDSQGNTWTCELGEKTAPAPSGQELRQQIDDGVRAATGSHHNVGFDPGKQRGRVRRIQ